MLIGFPFCSFKCDIENKTKLCQNYELTKSKNIEITYDEILDIYLSNKFNKAFVFGGLEPFDSYMDMLGLIKKIRLQLKDDIVIYTGYKEEELLKQTQELKKYKNITIKFGRFIPNQESHYDSILGVDLCSPNQYSKILTDTESIM